MLIFIRNLVSSSEAAIGYVSTFVVITGRSEERMYSGGTPSFTNDITVTSNNMGGGSPTPFITTPPTMLATIYVKL